MTGVVQHIHDGDRDEVRALLAAGLAPLEIVHGDGYRHNLFVVTARRREAVPADHVVLCRMSGHAGSWPGARGRPTRPTCCGWLSTTSSLRTAVPGTVLQDNTLGRRPAVPGILELLGVRVMHTSIAREVNGAAKPVERAFRDLDAGGRPASSGGRRLYRPIEHGEAGELRVAGAAAGDGVRGDDVRGRAGPSAALPATPSAQRPVRGAQPERQSRRARPGGGSGAAGTADPPRDEEERLMTGVVQHIHDGGPRSHRAAGAAGETRGWSLGEAAAAHRGLGFHDLASGCGSTYSGDNARIGQPRTEMARYRAGRLGAARGRARPARRSGGLRADRARGCAMRTRTATASSSTAPPAAARRGRSEALRATKSTGAWYTAMSPALTTPAAVLTRIARALDVGAGSDHRRRG